VDVVFSPSVDGGVLSHITAVAQGIQLTARLVDMPTNYLNTDHFLEEAKGVVARLKEKGLEVGIEVIRGEDLREKGFGGIYGG